MIDLIEGKKWDDPVFPASTNAPGRPPIPASRNSRASAQDRARSRGTGSRCLAFSECDGGQGDDFQSTSA